jgi:hypothetical protein
MGKRGKLLRLPKKFWELNTSQNFLGFEVFGLHLPMAAFWLWAKKFSN